jgi:hypothetical protein
MPSRTTSIGFPSGAVALAVLFAGSLIVLREPLDHVFGVEARRAGDVEYVVVSCQAFVFFLVAIPAGAAAVAYVRSRRA